ncbi:MAG: P-loop NTPase fold protein [Bacteroidota bacterium]
MYKDDIPISLPEEDILNRKDFAERLAKTITGWHSKKSIVVGLNGSWGSGKSSITCLVKHYLEQDQSKPTIIEFNPWMFSNLENLLRAFFNEISVHLGLEDTQNNEKLINKLKKYADLLTLVSDSELVSEGKLRNYLNCGIFSSILGGASSSIIGWPNEVRNTFFVVLFVMLLANYFQKYLLKVIKYFENRLSAQKGKSVLLVKEDIQKELENRDKKVVVIIDDIDRLTPNEVRDMFTLLKANADFSNTIYLLTYDHPRVVQSIKKTLGIDGSAFLEKIVQVSFNVPFIGKKEISELLWKEIDEIKNRISKTCNFPWDEEYLKEIRGSGFDDMFDNLRQVKKYLNSLEFNISLFIMENYLEVNLIDFIVLEAIRLFDTEFFVKLRENKELFLDNMGVWNAEKDLKQDQIKIKQRHEKVMSLINNEVRYKDTIFLLLKKLFPQFSGEEYYLYYFRAEYDEWLLNSRICSPDCFDIYFTMIPGNDQKKILQSELVKFMDAMSDSENIHELSTEYKQDQKLIVLSNQLRGYTIDEKMTPIYIKNLYLFFNECIENVTTNGTKAKNRKLIDSICELFFAILADRIDKESNYILLNEILCDSEKKYLIVKILCRIFQKRNERILLDKNVNSLRTDLIGALESALNNALNSKAMNVEIFLDLLDEFKRIGKKKDNKGEFNSFIKDIISCDDKIVCFAEKFIDVNGVRQPENYSADDQISFYTSEFDGFMDSDMLQSRMEKIIHDPESTEMLKEKAQSILEALESPINNFEIE